MHLHLIKFCLNSSLKRIFLLNRIVLGGPQRLLCFPNNPVSRHRLLRRSSRGNHGHGEQPYSHDTPTSVQHDSSSTSSPPHRSPARVEECLPPFAHAWRVSRRSPWLLMNSFSILLGLGFFFLLISLVGLHFKLLHDVLKVHPFCRSNHLKLKAELPPSAPPDNRCLNFYWRLALYRRDLELQRGSWLNIGGAFDSTASEERSTRLPSPPTMAMDENELLKLDAKPDILPLLHRRASQIDMLLSLYIPDWTQFQHLFCNSRTID